MTDKIIKSIAIIAFILITSTLISFIIILFGNYTTDINMAVIYRIFYITAPIHILCIIVSTIILKKLKRDENNLEGDKDE